ncbi:Asp-tRNA(Asn)/Glu-tRNA(Gln) amidotransferase subunit GatB [Chitinimonas sp. BJB300]|uniref:Asp-tRNA(Asn)/Glu-tRNA(Gln) amidotransferase subunit GatB n=1 Tax=Chitinimonas sp. BJB300 TaxID=1559339 RepID=UPI000C0EAD7C|nr:Asp-tRNA(Asn)/Glu-tRNA(Gln) amidotransferase subunit GatB [Chitinimonas sp. BJB300]PHV12646.1 Asp-tRNA(Asn)/Glu-tRNA(Gln) amidotransferase GatCAB subunit B [Chitinimonas sp. BJB300]TSJ91180.1 Asp-tRNA(Asn)/Glu-tRNA(Gln) amidotransferase subunit GatB [Chitinimonas sp. BJB300]
MQWEVVIGLEVHTQLSTQSKIFSSASTAFGAEPNTQTAVVDIALPGALPVMNKAAVEKAIQFGLAIGSKINRKSIFARKNYFYPDLPKGYQISQFELPVVEGGAITIRVGDEEKRINLTRAHLEEDAGKSVHEDFHGMSGIDLNRAGTPLLEIVSEPEMRSAAEAVAYAKALHSIVTWIGICDGNMQEGSFRCDVNVSVRPKGQKEFGTRREIKNLNSFKFIEQAIKYETQWQIEQIEDGEKIQQATVLFDPETGETRMMRSKEDAHDYRYFPDPDLPPLVIGEDWIERVKSELPELPEAMQARFQSQYGLSVYDSVTLTAGKDLAAYFEATVAAGADAKLASNWITGEVAATLNREEKGISETPVSAEALAQLIKRVMDSTINNKTAKDVLKKMWESGNAADTIIERDGLKQESDAGAVEAIIDGVLADNQAMVDEYKSGKEKAFNALVGQCMKASKGKANPAQVNEILKRKLG